MLTILFILALGLSFWAQFGVFSKIKKFARVPAPLNGRELAEKMLDENKIYDVKIIIKSGTIGSEYYNPKTKEIALSEECANSASISSISIAAHEVGHAIQHNTNETFSVIRTKIAQPISIISNVSFVIMFAGVILQHFMGYSPIFAYVGLIGFSLTLIFQFVNLPVEIDASKRAIAYLYNSHTLNEEQTRQSTSVLKAAAWTYIAAALVTLIQVLRILLWISSSSRN